MDSRFHRVGCLPSSALERRGTFAQQGDLVALVARAGCWAA
jgi:hypothetical protein